MAQNLSSVLMHNSITDTQAQSRALAYFLGRKEWVKNPFRMGDAMPVVAERNFHEPTRARGSNLNARLAASLPHSVICIVENIQKHLLELVRISDHAGQFLFKPLNHLDIVTLKVIGAYLDGAMCNRGKQYRFAERSW